MKIKLVILLLIVVGCSNKNEELDSNNRQLKSEIENITFKIGNKAASLGNTNWTLEYVAKSDSINNHFESKDSIESNEVQINKLRIQQLIAQNAVYSELVSNLYRVDKIEPFLIYGTDSTTIIMKSGLEVLIPFVKIISVEGELRIEFQSSMEGKIPTKYLTDDNVQVMLHSPSNYEESAWDLKKYTR